MVILIAIFVLILRAGSSIEGREAGEVFPDDQGVNALGSLESADGLKVTEVADDVMVSQQAG